MSASFAAINRNKRGIALDLQRPEGTKIAFELAKQADVVVENFLPGVAAKLGLGYEAVSAVNASVVYVSVTGFGQTGPHSKRPGYNTIAQGMSGLMALTGHPGDPPTRVAGSTSDLAAAITAFGSVCAALVQRFRTGRGQYLDVSLLASSLSLLPDPTAIYFDTKNKPKREGNRNSAIAPGGAYKTQDGYLNIVLMNEDQWKRFCVALGEPELATKPGFASNAERISRYDDFVAYIEERSRQGPHRGVGRALREGPGRRGAGVRIPRGIRRRTGEAPGPRGAHGAAGPRNGPRAPLPHASVGGTRPHTPRRPAAGPAHRRSLARARLRRGGDHAVGRGGHGQARRMRPAGCLTAG